MKNQLYLAEKIAILEQNTEEFETARGKNTFIRSTDEEWIGFIDGAVTDGEEVCSIIEELPFAKDYDVILFGENVPEGECDLLQLLECPECIIFAICFRRSLLVQTGSYNRLLSGSCNYEFLLRLAEVGKVYSIPCRADNKVAEVDPFTLAYIVRRYMSKMKENGSLDDIFLRVVQVTERLGIAAAFNRAMQEFLADDDTYDKIATDTAPWFVLVGDDTCFGVLADFANSLADELVKLGQAVMISNDKYGNYHKTSTQKLVSQCYKAIVGFQAPVLEIEIFQKMTGKRCQFWFDNPLFFDDFFSTVSRETYMLCQDAYYAEFIRKHYDIPSTIQFPPAGNVPEQVFEDKIYDVVFVGSYEPLPAMDYKDSCRREFGEYMLEHPNDTFEQGIYGYCRERNMSCDEKDLMARLQEWKDVCFDVLQIERHRVIEAVLKECIQLHVFGESWRNYRGLGKENLIIHPQVRGKEALEVWSKSKIGFNIMRGHRAGMTERIANIMLCGACCVSDETIYLAEHFCDGKEIVLYKRDELEKLPQLIRYLLEHDEEREGIARAGQKKALVEHTWRKRAEELCELIDFAV